MVPKGQCVIHTSTASKLGFYIVLATRQTDISTSVIQIPTTTPPPPLSIIANMRGLVIVGTRSGLVFEQLVITYFHFL